MATLDTRQQIHSAVLPQRRTLESASADNPGAGTKRDAEAFRQRSAQHGQGETHRASPGVAGVTRASGARGRETVERLRRLAPVRAIHIETVRFDTHALAAGRPLEGVEYQHGTLHGYEVREYLLEKWGRACAYCAAENTPLNIDHIQPRSRGGSDRISNLTVACVPCNQSKNNMPVTEFLARRPAILARLLAQAKTPLRDAAAVNATRRALYASLTATGLPVRRGSGGRTKWNRHRTGAPKSHTLDALHVGQLDHVASWPSRMLVVAATGRGTYCRTRTDAFGFPRLRLPRTKQIHGYQTGDLVRAIVPKGKHAGTHTGRVAVRTSGSHTVQTTTGPIKTLYKHLRLLQRADGYGYTTQREQHPCAP
ncbi:hypothetical protein GCM10020216_064620 [Nonomuraea helvata]